MEKLLHERLKEDDGVLCPIKAFNGIDKCPPDIDCRFCRNNALSDLADEIELYYIPRPRFEDGTPMHLGDMCDFGDYFDKDEQVKEIFGLHYVNDGEWSIQPLNESYKARLDNCKRPTPKVLDADDVEIKVGDKVYELKNGKELRIEEADAHHILCAHVDGYGSYEGFDADQLTHEQPVFDADGVRICKGDTVWDKAGAKLTVTMPYQYGRVYYETESGETRECSPNELTHREPDSLEKLLDDMKRNNIDPIPMEINAWVDRLTALIERGA